MSKSESLPIWRLKSQADRRFRAGHPWIYSNELQESPKGITPGALIELHDAGGKFLARGYGNPSSLIAFRALSRDAENATPDSAASLHAALREASQVRDSLGLGELSHRLCFAEADQLPGLVIDRYRIGPKSNGSQVFAVQLHTAGTDRLRDAIVEALELLVASEKRVSWAKTAVVIRNDLGMRKLEGLAPQDAFVVKAAAGVDLSRPVTIRVAAAIPGEQIEFSVDLLEGQKTGFFLDQAANIELAAQRLAGLKVVRVLDLFCYAGQWSAKLAQAFRARGIRLEVTAVDASASALERAKANIEAQGARCEIIKTDLVRPEALAGLAERSFDLVICDPPALIKGRKDIPPGTHAYLQLNTQAIRLVRPGGAIVTCSCSGLLEEEDFLKALSKAAYRNKANVRWIARGTQSPDHPMRIEFPEGRYLKCMIGLVAPERAQPC